MKRFFAIILATLTLAALLAGCTRHQALDAFNAGIEFVGNAPLLFARRLVGTRVYGQDCYTGNYRGDYEDFTGFECLFGGTSHLGGSAAGCFGRTGTFAGTCCGSFCFTQCALQCAVV